MLNKRSNHLVILVATYNRLEPLKLSLASIAEGTRCSHEIIVIDGGSGDGTVDYLKLHPGVTPVFQGGLLGTARCYNEVWRQIESKYTCWLSDDTEVIAGSLDLAVGILDEHTEVGMVGLKMKDTVGPWEKEAYMGALTEYGIITCNHGVLRTNLLKSLGYFNERYHSYTIDADLTASVLSAGKRVVLTKHVSVLHHREWATHEVEAKIKRETKGIDNAQVYHEKFGFLEASHNLWARLSASFGYRLARRLFSASSQRSTWAGLSRRDWINLTAGRFIRFADPIENRGRPYHLVQRIPPSLLNSKRNPYGHLVRSENTLDGPYRSRERIIDVKRVDHSTTYDQ